jgi:hypothetical protein
MSKTQKELAFLRDLYIETDWSERFTNLFDENFKFTDEEKILYLNAGTGNHALALNAKLKKKDVEIFAVSENKELQKIAQAKADLIKTNINFSTEYPSKKFDAVLADASFVKPVEVVDFLTQAVSLSDNQAAFFLPTAGSFGEIFSILWETFFNAGLTEKGAEVERLISELPTVSKIEELAESLNLTKIEAITKTEFFEFENGEAFVNSPLANDFLFPVWLDFLSEKEKKQVVKKLAKTIDDDCQELSFRFSVKATLIVGEKP